MPIDFPSSPSVGQNYSYGGVNYTFTTTGVWAMGRRAPTRQVFTSGSGTYTKPTDCLYIEVEMVGGGCGGQNGLATAGAAGANTTFGSSFLNAVAAVNFAGGTPSGGDINIRGGDGSSSGNIADNTSFASGGNGGNSFFGGAGMGFYNNTGTAGSPNTGGGGGGGGRNTATLAGGGIGGGAGGYLRKLIASPSSTYAYTVGGGGSGAAASGAGYAGGNGGSGIIIVTEWYN